MGHPPRIGARMKKPAYGLNGALRRWQMFPLVRIGPLRQTDVRLSFMGR